MSVNELLIEDWELESQKDSIYLQERQFEIEQEFHIPEFGEIEIDYDIREMETNYGGRIQQ